MKEIKVKVTAKCNDGFSFSLIEDYTDYAEDLIECNNVFTSTNIKMTEENILDYFKEGEFKDSEIESLNGDHFIFGWLETISQSDYANIFYKHNHNWTFIVELV